jgi:hypothetical protein
MGRVYAWRFAGVLLLSILLTSSLSIVAEAQGLQQSPYSAPSMLRGTSSGGLDLAPSNPLGLPGSSTHWAGGSQSLHVSDAMFRGILPLIPNLQFGFLFDFGNRKVVQGRFTTDYLLPFSLSPCSVIFGEGHAEFQDFWNTQSFSNRTDVSFGGGYRTLLRPDLLVGLNGFYDGSGWGGPWYSSGGIGFETAALFKNFDAADFHFNWYGLLFNNDLIPNVFRTGPSNFDFEAGYSRELPWIWTDLRLKMTGYRFDVGSGVWGWNAGAELKSRDGMFVVKYDVGHDRVNQTYQTFGAFVNVGFKLGNLFKGESPITLPEPIFRSPRTLRYVLTQPVKRDWHQPAAALVARAQQATAQPAGATPSFIFALGPPLVGSITYTQDSACTGTIHVAPGLIDVANFYSITIAGTNGLSFPLTASITATTQNALFIIVREDGNPFLPETVTFPNSAILTRQVPPDGNSGGAISVPRVGAGPMGLQGTITITAPGVQTLTITIVAP